TATEAAPWMARAGRGKPQAPPPQPHARGSQRWSEPVPRAEPKAKRCRLVANLREVTGRTRMQLDGHTVLGGLQADEPAGGVGGSHPVQVLKQGLGQVVDQVGVQLGPD